MVINNKKLDELLIARCWDDSDLARAIERTPAALYYQRYYTKKPYKSTIGRIAKALQVDYREFVDVDNPNTQKEAV